VHISAILFLGGVLWFEEGCRERLKIQEKNGHYDLWKTKFGLVKVQKRERKYTKYEAKG
jgi:hypothetical protein